MLRRIVSVIFLLMGTVGSGAGEQTINWQRDGIYVIDGDTYKIGDKRYRLCGINTPEKGQAGYSEAGAALKLLMQRSGDIKIYYGRCGTLWKGNCRDAPRKI